MPRFNPIFPNNSFNFFHIQNINIIFHNINTHHILKNHIRESHKTQPATNRPKRSKKNFSDNRHQKEKPPIIRKGGFK